MKRQLRWNSADHPRPPGSLPGPRALADPGNAADPGENQLSVAAGFALGDLRFPDFAPIIDAVGTTLNGNSCAGQTVTGPSEAPPDVRTEAGIIPF